MRSALPRPAGGLSIEPRGETMRGLEVARAMLVMNGEGLHRPLLECRRSAVAARVFEHSLPGCCRIGMPARAIEQRRKSSKRLQTHLAFPT